MIGWKTETEEHTRAQGPASQDRPPTACRSEPAAAGKVRAIVDGRSSPASRFHDLRGTAATRFYVAGLSERVIAEIMGWEEEHVAKIVRRYVDRAAAARTIIKRSTKREHKSPNSLQNHPSETG